MTQIIIGAMCAPIHEQIGVTAESVKTYQRAVDSMIFLYIRGYLTESDHDKVGRRIVKDLQGYVVRQQKTEEQTE